MRKQAIDGMLFSQGVPPDNLPLLEEDELLDIMIEDLKQPKEGLLDEFSPVLVNVLQQYLRA